MATVALVYNLVHPEKLKGAPLDSIAEYDTEDTVTALRTAIESGGHTVISLEADETIMERLRELRPDVVFNVAEGLRGESRESHVPAICEMLGLHYTGSAPLTLALCLDKARAKEVLLHYGVATPRFQVLEARDVPLRDGLRYPLILKLLHEGSSMGLSDASVVDDEAALRRQAGYLLEAYREPVLVEEFIQGREFTVGLLGNGSLRVLPIIETVFSRPRGIVLFEPDPLMVQMMEAQGIDPSRIPKPCHRSICPAEIDDALRERIEETARRAFTALGCRDWCRMEMRLGADDTLYVLELNPIAGIAPGYWLPRAAQVAGMSYADFVNEILDHSLARMNGR